MAFSANRFAVCFNGIYKPGLKNDCILMSGGTADRADLEILTKDIPTGSGVHKLLPNLKNAGKCVNLIPLKDSQQSKVSIFNLISVKFILDLLSVFFINEMILIIKRTDISNHSLFYRVNHV